VKKNIVWLVVSCLMVLSLALAACAPGGPTTPTTPTTPTNPTTPTTPTTPSTPAGVTVPDVVSPNAEVVKLTLTKKDGTIVEKWVEKPRYGGWIYMGVDAADGVKGFDPAMNNEAATARLSDYVGLQMLSGDWYMGPAGTEEAGYTANIFDLSWEKWLIAESWELTGTDELTFKIRQGIHFALDPKNEASKLVGGRELTANDVAYAINRDWTEPASFVRSSRAGALKKATATDKYTCVVEANPGQAAVIIEVFPILTVYPPEIISKYGNMNQWDRYVGAGPFILTDFVSQSSSTLTRNSNFFLSDPLFPENQLPYVDGVYFLEIGDPSTALAGMRTGRLDQYRPRAPVISDLLSMQQTNPDVKYNTYPATSPPMIFMRIDKPELPFYDIRVRKALHMAINMKEIQDTFYQGFADSGFNYPVPDWPEYRAMGMFIPLEELSQSIQEDYAYNPTKAKALLAEAGFPNGFNTEIVLQQKDVDLASIVVAYWQKIGVNLKLDVKDPAVFTAINANRSHTQMQWYYSNAYAPMQFFEARTTDPHNASLVNDQKAMDMYYDIWAHYFDTDYKVKKMGEWIPYALEHVWHIPVPGGNSYIIWQPWLKAYHGIYSVGKSDYGQWTWYSWIDQDMKQQMIGKR